MIITGKIPQEDLDILNKRLVDIYGISFNDLPHFRVIWSDDELELRQMNYTDDGRFLLPQPVVKQVPKYKQWVQHKYILEGLKEIPQYTETDLVSKLSYEPVWVFEDKHGNALFPKWEAIHFVLDALQQSARAGYTKYKDPEVNETLEQKKIRIDGIVEELFGNETDTGTALAHKEAVVVPNKEFN